MPYRNRNYLREGVMSLRGDYVLGAEELSTYDSESGGFHVAMSEADSDTMGIGAIQTGQCAVKLVAVSPPELEDQLRLRVSKGERIEIDVAITGRFPKNRLSTISPTTNRDKTS
jgi:hypothetical protein